MTRKTLRKAGYAVTARKTGAGYPNHARNIGLEWQFVLTSPDGSERTFSTHTAAWSFAHRLSQQVA